MTLNTKPDLLNIICKASTWAEDQHSTLLRLGLPLNEMQLALARNIGVPHPERIRILEATSFPAPEDLKLKQAVLSLGLLGPGMTDLTLGYGIYISCRKVSDRLLSHEFRHIQQYKFAGSISEFLANHLG